MAIEIYQLDLYDDAGTSIVASFSTDPGHARPYLIAPENLASQEISFAEGRATIGGCNVEIVDVPTDPADQDTGYVTSILADAMGRRAHLRHWIAGAFENVLNAVVSSIVLHESYSSYTLTLKDQRENERNISAFTRATSASIHPPGVIGGFGFNATTGKWLIPPTEPIEAVYTEYTASGLIYGLLTFPQREDRVPLWQVVSTRAEAALKSFDPRYVDPPPVTEPTQYGYDLVSLHWRESPFSGAFDIVDNPGWGGWLFLGGTYRDTTGQIHDVRYIKFWQFIWPTGASRPTHNTTIQVIFGYAGPTSEEYPLHLEGLTFGEVLKGLYDGDYSSGTVPPIQYDSAAVLALTDPYRGRVTEPLDSEDGIWKWVEENIYAITGSAPALDSQGRIAPVKYELPPAGASLLTLDDSICEPSPGWTHGSDDVINSVSVEYARLVAVPGDTDPTGARASGDGLVERPIKVILGEELPELQASIAIFGKRWLKLESAGLTAIGGADGEPVTGDVIDELGTQIAAKRAREAVDRFLYGGQHFTVLVDRSALGSRGVGAWCIVACSWMPNYVTGERGANNLAQIMRVTPLDSTWSEVALIDAGPNNAPMGAPTLGSVTVDAAGVVSVPVTAVPAGGDARVDYAVSVLEPAADSPLWQFVGRTSTTATLLTPAVPAGAVVWVRSRGEKEGRRPSAWTTAVTVTAPSTPRVSLVRVDVNQADGSVVVTWERNAFTLGVRLHWDAHDPLAAPSFATVDVDASLLTHTFAAGTVTPGEAFTVDAEPYPGWTGSAVSGTAGAKVRASGLRDAYPDTIATGYAKLDVDAITGVVSLAVGSTDPDTDRAYWEISKVGYPTVTTGDATIARSAMPYSAATATTLAVGEKAYLVLRFYNDVYGFGAEVRDVVPFTPSGKRIPAISFEVSQAGSTGTATITIDDPDLLLTAVEFKKKIGAAAFDASWLTSWDGSTGTIGVSTSIIRSEGVAIDDKHNSQILVHVAYVLGASTFDVILPHTFDIDFEAHILGFTIGFTGTNAVEISDITSDEDTANIYCTVTVNGSTPSDPTSGTNNGSLAGRTGTITTTVIATPGQIAKVKLRGYNSNPSAGPVVEGQALCPGVEIRQFFVEDSGDDGTGCGDSGTLFYTWEVAAPAGFTVTIELYANGELIATPVSSSGSLTASAAEHSRFGYLDGGGSYYEYGAKIIVKDNATSPVVRGTALSPYPVIKTLEISCI